MPVEDHPIHPSTQKGADFRYGCWNREEYSEGYWVEVRDYFSDGKYAKRQEFIPFRMSRECMTAATGWAATDVNCEGCKRRRA